MENFQFIEYHRKRDFSKKVNATFEFIKQNFKSLFKSILFIAGPPVLIGSMLIGSFVGQLFGMTAIAPDPSAMQAMFTGSFWLQLLFTFVFILISGVITIATINNYLLLYGEKKTNKIEVSEVWARVRDTFWMYLGTMIFFAVLFVVVYFVMLVPVIALGTISPALVFFGILFAVIGLFYLLISVSLTFIVRAYEQVGFFEALSRSYRLVQGKWWSTFGLLFILQMIMGIISYIPLIPFYAMLFMKALHTAEATSTESSVSWEILVTIFFTIYYLLQMLLYTLPNIGIAFQYFNLVELKEAKGLMSDIETLGKLQEADRPEESF